jgi:hypothetical protein
MAKRYHRGNQKPLEEEQTIQWLKEIGEAMIHKILHRKPTTVQHEPHLKPG